MAAIGFRARIVLAVVALVFAAGGVLFSGSAAASGGCDRVASPSGSDTNAGNEESPWQSAQYMVDHLAAGQTGCFRAGTFAFGEVDIAQSGITLTSYPGERATLGGTLKIEQGADQVTVSDLDLDGRGSSDIGPFVFGNGTTFDNVDVTNHHAEICFMVGASNPADGYAVGTVIENSRIHDCGKLPSGNGDHGIYVEHASGTVIRNNWIYDNADRGVQLYPESRGAQVYGNVIDGNGEGVIISDASSENEVYDNVISNSKLRWNVESSNLYGSGNVVRDNCVWASNSNEGGYYRQNGGILPPSEGGDAFAVSGNVVANPQFANPAARDLNQQSDSPCLVPPPVISLRPAVSHVQVGSPIRLRGQVAPDAPTQVTIQVLHKRHWTRFVEARVRPSGRFSVQKRLGSRLASATDRIWLRAKLPHVGRSRPVAVGVRH